MAELSTAVDNVRLDDDSHQAGSIEEGFTQYAEDQPDDKLPFYEIEGQILSLWDRLNELKLEIAVLEKPTVELPDLSDEEAKIELEEAEKECLEARAQYMLRQSVVEDTIISSPILNAIHAGDNATGSERTLKPLLDRRDELEIASTNLSSILSSTLERTRKAEIENLTAIEKNREFTASLIRLNDKIRDRKDSVSEQPQLNTRLEETRKEAATAVRQWRIMKSVVSAVIAGSGVDWSRDSHLRDLVLDAEDESF